MADIEVINLAAQEAQRAAVDRFLKTNFAFLGPDRELMANHHIAARSPREKEVLGLPIDTNLFAELRGRLTATLDETFEITELTVSSPAAQCGDMSTAILTASGDVALTSNRGVVGFAAIMHYVVRFILKYYATEPSIGIREGDAFLVNDCRYGGIHNPDQGLYMPVFHDGELVCWVCCNFHEGEIGARTPGGMGPTIESKWDEGFKGSPLKVAERNVLRMDIVTLLQNNSREPQSIIADLKGRLAACRRIECSVQAEIGRNRVSNLIGFLRSNIEFARDEAARRLAEMPDGTVRVTMYADDTMREAALIKINMAMTKTGDRVVIDLRGSSPQIANRPINTLRQGCAIGTMMTVTYHLWPDLPAGQALIDNFEFITDPGSILDCDLEVPVALCMNTFFKLMSCVEMALAKFTYGLPAQHRYTKVRAGWFNQPSAIIYGGLSQHFDSVGNVCGDLNGMGGGAKSDGDGEHSIAPSFAAAVDTGESEHLEDNLPFIYAISKRLWPDNCGFGKFRGGAAYQYGLMRFGSQPFGFMTLSSGSYFPSTIGLFGGYGIPVYAGCKIRGRNIFKDMKSRPQLFKASLEYLMNEQPFEGARYETTSMAMPFELYGEGELIMVSQGAGGGYGDVLDRAPEHVIRDLEEAVISHRTARSIYFVAYDQETLLIDQEATRSARAAEREARKTRASSWDGFCARTTRSEPPAEANFFGSWNGSEDLYAGQFYPKAKPGAQLMILLPDPKDLEIVELKAKLATLVNSGTKAA